MFFNATKRQPRFQKFISTLIISTMSLSFLLTGLPSKSGLRPNSGIETAEAAEEHQFVAKWGSEGSGDGQFSNPTGLAIDSSESIYVVDNGNNRIQKFNLTGEFITKWGSYGTGNGQFDYPKGIAVNSQGEVYVADTNNNCIQKFTSSGTFIKKWGSWGWDDGQFVSPEGITVDSSGYVYVAGFFNHNIQKFDSNGNFITKWGDMGSSDGLFWRPTGVVADYSGNIFVADSLNYRIQKFDSNGNFITKWGSKGSNDGQFNESGGIATDSLGNVYVADAENNRIQKFDSNGNFLTKWGSYGSNNGEFMYPSDIDVDSSNNVIVIDTSNSRVQVFSTILPDTMGPSISITNPTNNQIVNGTINIDATVDDSMAGNSNIAEAVYYIDSQTISYQMNPTTGSFDSPIEDATGTLDTTSILNGKHTISVQGKDDAGNWSSKETISININNPTFMNRASVDSQGNQVNYSYGEVWYNFGPSISSDGRYVAFRSYASKLVSDDTNGTWDIFRKDLQTGEVTRVSTDSSGNQANSYSERFSISADGRYVVFESEASNLVNGDINEVPDIFRKDTQTGTTIRVSTDSQENETTGGSYNPSISSDGRYVVFVSNTSDLVIGDTNSVNDIFRKDLVTGEVIRVSTDSQGNEANDEGWYSSISSDGRYVVFDSYASNLVSGDTNGNGDIFRKDLTTGEIVRVSTSSDGSQANSYSDWPSFSSDGRFVAYVSRATNLVPDDTNEDTLDVFRKDLTTGENIRVTTDSQGNEAFYGGGMYPPSISSDGRYVVFDSDDSELVLGDTNWYGDVFRKDLTTNETVRVSVNSYNNQANATSYYPAISSDGRYIAFLSEATNLVLGDTNGVDDVFVADMNLYSSSSSSDSSTPVTTKALSKSANSLGWHNTSVTITLSATDTGEAGLYNTYYRIGSSGAYKTYTAPFSISTEGIKTINYYSEDNAINQETIKSLPIRIDKTKPKTYAPYSKSVKRYSYVRLYYKVVDSGSPYNYVTIKIKNLSGVVKKIIYPGWKTPNKLLYYNYKASLAKGTYKFYIYAKDKAGNTQYNTAYNKLVIK